MIKNIVKRNGDLARYDGERIKNAIKKAMEETSIGVDEDIVNSVEQSVNKMTSGAKGILTISLIEKLICDLLELAGREDVSKTYLDYSVAREKVREAKSPFNLLTNKFISKYKHLPNPMNQLGSFVYYRTYSRWLPEESRREYWWETVRRAVEYNVSLDTFGGAGQEEAEELFDNIFHLRQFLSGRTFWVGGTDVSKYYPMGNFNCAFQTVENIGDFRDLFYLLMVGSGVGVRILEEDVVNIPRFRTDLTILHKPHVAIPKGQREEHTTFSFPEPETIEIIIGDSKEGWVNSLLYFLEAMTSNTYRKVTTIVMNYDNIRPFGEKLVTFGGRASGHASIQSMFEKIAKVVANRGDSKLAKLTPIDVLDIANIIGENVVVGGVRRTAEIALLDQNDHESIGAKDNLYTNVDGNWSVNTDIIHRQMSNNSIYYKEKPTRERLHWQIEKMRYSGEPGWVNEVAAAKRRPNFKGVNPCGEILLDNKGLCNLTTTNVLAFVNLRSRTLDRDRLLRAHGLSAKAGYRMTMSELELPEWNAKQKRDRLVGASVTGWQDMVNALGFSKEEEAQLLRDLRKAAHDAVYEYADSLGFNRPLLVTTVKPEGTLSQLPGVSSGVHYSHSPYFIRRVRISSSDPLVKVAEELGWTVKAEVGQEWETCTTKVVEFPSIAPEGRTKNDVSAIEQLENYLMFMENYVDHNTSITVHVREHEWELVEQWVWDHWDECVALSFLSLDDNYYDLLPYESIDKETYDRLKSEMKPFVPSLITKYEIKEQELADLNDDGCNSGACGVR